MVSVRTAYNGSFPIQLQKLEPYLSLVSWSVFLAARRRNRDTSRLVESIRLHLRTDNRNLEQLGSCQERFNCLHGADSRAAAEHRLRETDGIPPASLKPME